MSQWVKHHSPILVNVNKTHLEKAMAELGLTLDNNCNTIRNSWGRASVDAGISRNGQALSLGLRYVEQNGNTALELEGDFYMTGLSGTSFMNELSQQYTKVRAVQALENDRWDIENVKQDGGDILITAEQTTY